MALFSLNITEQYQGMFAGVSRPPFGGFQPGVVNAARRMAASIRDYAGQSMWRGIVGDSYGLANALKIGVRHDLADQGIPAQINFTIVGTGSASQEDMFRRYVWATHGIKPHTIYPNAKKFLGGDNLGHPLAWAKHPGVPARGDYAAKLGELVLSSAAQSWLDELKLEFVS